MILYIYGGAYVVNVLSSVILLFIIVSWDDYHICVIYANYYYLSYRIHSYIAIAAPPIVLLEGGALSP